MTKKALKKQLKKQLKKAAKQAAKNKKAILGIYSNLYYMLDY